MLPKQLRVFTFDPDAVAILPDGCLEGNTAIRVDGIAGPSEEGFRQATIGSKVGGPRSVPRYGFTGVTTDKEPFAGLPLQLKDVQRVLVCAIIGRTEMRGFTLQCEPRSWSSDISARHDHFRIEALDIDLNAARSKARGGHKRRQVIKTLVKGEFIFNGARMIPSQARLWSSGKHHSCITQRDARRQFRSRRPALIGKWDAAGRETWRPDGLDRVRAFLDIESSRCDSKKVIIDDCQKVARREAIGWCDDIRLAPPYELLSNFECHRPVVIRRAKLANFTGPPLPFAILPRQR